MTGTATDRGRQWPAFDGLRAIAVLAVVVFHASYPSFIHGGYVGVDVFFVLSGFLITWLLTTERDALEGIAYRKFYARRALRLFPALGALIVVSVILVAADGGLSAYRHETFIGLPWVVFYLGNWPIAWGTSLTLGLLAITWTLAIEEQYYLLWPVALNKMLARFDRRRIAAGLIVAAILEEVVRFGMGLSNDLAISEWADKATVTHSDGLLVGSALALMWTTRATWKLWPTIVKRANELGVVGAALIGITIIIGKPGFVATDVWKTYVWETVAVYGTLLLVTSLVARPTSWISTILSLAPLQWIGKRSYGMYIWHYPIIVLVLTFNLPAKHVHFTRFAIEIVAIFIVTAISYQVIEQPFLRRKIRFARIPQETSTP